MKRLLVPFVLSTLALSACSGGEEFAYCEQKDGVSKHTLCIAGALSNDGTGDLLINWDYDYPAETVLGNISEIEAFFYVDCPSDAVELTVTTIRFDDEYETVYYSNSASGLNEYTPSEEVVNISNGIQSEMTNLIKQRFCQQ